MKRFIVFLCGIFTSHSKFKVNMFKDGYTVQCDFCKTYLKRKSNDKN